MEIRNKTVLLTGASRGIGQFIARTLASEGAVVIGVARSQEGLHNTQRNIENDGGTFFSLSFDLKNINGQMKMVYIQKVIVHCTQKFMMLYCQY